MLGQKQPENTIPVNFNTRNPFEGHVYVKGLYDQAGCRSDEGGRQVAGIELPFDSCNTARTRSLNPKGVFVSTTVVISFHPQFVTKVDRYVCLFGGRETKQKKTKEKKKN